MRSSLILYTSSDAKAKEGNLAIEDPRLAGYCERRPTHVRKLAMVMSLSRSNEVVIGTEDFERALHVMQDAEKKMPQVFGGMGSSPYALITEKIIVFLRNVGEIKRSLLLRRFKGDIDTQTLEVVEDIIIKMKIVKVRELPEQRDKVYQYIGP